MFMLFFQLLQRFIMYHENIWNLINAQTLHSINGLLTAGRTKLLKPNFPPHITARVSFCTANSKNKVLLPEAAILWTVLRCQLACAFIWTHDWVGGHRWHPYIWKQRPSFRIIDFGSWQNWLFFKGGQGTTNIKGRSWQKKWGKNNTN